MDGRRSSPVLQQITPSKPLPDKKPARSSIKSAVKKITRIFFFSFRSKRPPETKSSIPDNTSSRDVSYSTAPSNGSTSTLRYSKSYGSSASSNALLGTGNFSIRDIHQATNNFSSKYEIGLGGFGTVYKGTLRDGSLIAIKRAKKGMYDTHLSTEFKNEILTLSQIEHQSLVRLFGYLEHGDEKIIVTEYVANGTLRDHLHGRMGNGLDMSERLDIAIDVAHAVTYLHMYTERAIIHRDIKPSNILITEKLRAKVSDFGFARLASEDAGATHISTQVKGTAGYLDPEYIRTYQLTEKSDVYSFGVVLVELVSGRHPTEENRPARERNTIKWAMQKLKERDAVLVMDPLVRRNPASTYAAEAMLKLARQCVAPTRQLRPSMKRCAEVLWEIRKNHKEKATCGPSPRRSANFAADDRRKYISASPSV